MTWFQAAIVIASAQAPAQPRSNAELEPAIRKACLQCHVFPPPEILPKKSWLGMLNLMLDLASPGQLNRPLSTTGSQTIRIP
jgi:hypothetical protein